MSSIFSRLTFLQRPTKYKAGKLYSVLPANGAGDFSVVRAGSKHRMNSAGVLELMGNNIPAIDWVGATPAYNGLLVERAATNLGIRSNEFDNGAWFKTNVTISPNNSADPFGTNTADLAAENAGAGEKSVQATSYTSVANQIVTQWWLIKAAGRTRVRIDTYSGAFINWASGIYTLTGAGSAVTGSASGSVVNYKQEIRALPNGWYLIALTYAHTVDGLSINNRIRFDNGSTTSYTGDGASGYLLAHYQRVTSYSISSAITTGASSASRVADAISKTGISAYLNNTDREGTIVAVIRRDLQTLAAELLSFTQTAGSTTNRILLATTADDRIRAVVTNSGVDQADIQSATNQSGVLRIIFAYKDNDCQLYINGVSAGTDTGVTIPGSLDEVYLGGVSVANNANFWLKCLAVHPKRLNATDIAALDAQLALNVT